MKSDNRKKLPVGIEDFAEIRTEDFYYVDKTGMITDLLRNWGKVNLFTRPRRFGKSLNMSMLKNFFELGCEESLFENLDISKEQDLCEKYMGKYPVIFISLKDVCADDFQTARSMMCSVIGSEALRFKEIADSNRLSEVEKTRYHAFLRMDDTGNFQLSDEMLMNGLLTLSRLLQKHYQKKVIILIDEYDVPLAKANEQGYYDEMAALIRNIFSSSLKTNDSLYFAVLTGCLRVAKESIFTGMNNLKILTISDVRFDEYFGFTDEEVKQMLAYYGLMDFYEPVKEWYDGYSFGNVDVYCPWDVISYCDELRANPKASPKDYWSNTSSNEAVKRFIEKAHTNTIKREIEKLVAGETVVKEIRQDLVYKGLYDSMENIWSMLYMTGYLTKRGEVSGDRVFLAIPNMEIRNIYTRQIMELFKKNAYNDGEALHAFCEALKQGDAKKVEICFSEYLKKTISIRDTFVRKNTKENFYHGILLGLLGFKENWNVSSNKESGNGYNDIQVEIDEEETGIVIEVKYAQDGNMDSACAEALEQIERNDYASLLREDGMKHILKYGIACCKKNCKVVVKCE